MVNKLVESYPERWKYVDDLSFTEICHKDSPSNVYGTIEDNKNQTASNEMVVNIDKSAVLPISFLKTEPTYYPPLHQKQMVTIIKLLGVHISSDMKWDKEVGSKSQMWKYGYLCNEVAISLWCSCRTSSEVLNFFHYTYLRILLSSMAFPPYS